jgi:hypothetical protein
VTLGQVPQSFLFGSVSGSWVAFALFAGMAIVVGFAAASILRRFAARAGERAFLGTTPVARRAIGVLGAGAVLVATWWWLWSGFYALDVRPESVRLEYHGPRRDRVLAKSDIAAAWWNPGPKSTRVFVLRTRAGRSYRSTQTTANSAFERRVLRAVGGDAPEQ